MRRSIRTRWNSEKTKEVRIFRLCPFDLQWLTGVVNLGKWILRYLFANLIDEEIRRDAAHRATLKPDLPAYSETAKPQSKSSQASRSSPQQPWLEDDSAITPRPINGVASTPGLAIGVATPGTAGLTVPTSTGPTSGGSEDQKSNPGASRTSGDYFSNAPPPVPPLPAQFAHQASRPISFTKGYAADVEMQEIDENDEDAGVFGHMER